MVLESLLNRTFGRPTGLLGRLGGKLMARSKGAFVEWVVAELDLEPNDHVLEVGFGPGIGIQQLSEAVPDGFVAGIDASPEMVEQARKRNVGAIHEGRVELRQSVANDVPSEDDVFDAAMTMNSVQVWPDAVAGLRELRRVVKPGGTVAVAFTHHSGQSKGELPGLLEEAGFEEIRFEDRGDDFCVFATA